MMHASSIIESGKEEPFLTSNCFTLIEVFGIIKIGDLYAFSESFLGRQEED